MSRLQQLIQELCPDGVKYVKLEDVCVFERGTSITKKDIIEGDIPVVAGGQEPAYYCNQANRTGETVVISSSGAYAGYVSYWNQPIFVSDAFTVKPNDFLLTKYLYYFLVSKQARIYSLQKGGGVPHVYSSDVALLKIPIPPISVQQEIVRILDTFTGLNKELNAELTARRKQYEYYRDTLLNFTDEYETKQFGEIATIVRGASPRPIRNFIVEFIPIKYLAEVGTGSSDRVNAVDDGKYPFYVRSKIILRSNRYLFDEEAIIIPGEGGIGEIFHYVNGKYDLHQRAYRIHFVDKRVLTKFAYYYFKAYFKKFIMKRAVSATVTSIRKPMIDNFLIPLPPLFIQQKIVQILDTFTELNKELYAELAARKKQYEYYLNKLLDFKEVTS